jgi:hypothetical protein
MATAGAAIAAMIANAIKASGVLFELSQRISKTFLVKRRSHSSFRPRAGFFPPTINTLVSYKGFAFFTKSSTPLLFPTGVETVKAKKIWIPG